MSLPLAAVLSPPQDVGMPEKPTRRRFTAAYKLKILAEAAACTTPGSVGALLRREGLYSSHLAAWRAAEQAGTLRGPAPRRGPKPASVTAREVAILERKLARAEARATRAEALIELQKKVAQLFGEPLPESDERS
jgi:transposase-like protein